MARNIAINFDVTGVVRNLPDGRVELIAEGPGSQVEGFVEAICDRMRPYIRQTTLDNEPVSGQYGQFTIGR